MSRDDVPSGLVFVILAAVTLKPPSETSESLHQGVTGSGLSLRCFWRSAPELGEFAQIVGASLRKRSAQSKLLAVSRVRFVEDLAGPSFMTCTSHTGGDIIY